MVFFPPSLWIVKNSMYNSLDSFLFVLSDCLKFHQWEPCQLALLYPGSPLHTLNYSRC